MPLIISSLLVNIIIYLFLCLSQSFSLQSFFFGHYEQRVSTVALCQLLSHCLNTGDQRLNSIVVTEEDTSNQSDGQKCSEIIKKI